MDSPHEVASAEGGEYSLKVPKIPMSACLVDSFGSHGLFVEPIGVRSY